MTHMATWLLWLHGAFGVLVLGMALWIWLSWRSMSDVSRIMGNPGSLAAGTRSLKSRCDNSEKELASMRRIQNIALAPEKNTDIQVGQYDWIYEPARGVSGDLVYARNFGNGVLFFVGDALDKGAGAAFVMAIIKGILIAAEPNPDYDRPESNAGFGPDLLRMAKKIDSVARNAAATVTGVVGYSETNSAGHTRLKFLSFEHPYPIRITPFGNQQVDEVHGFAFGEEPFEEEMTPTTIALAAGESIIFFSDGLFEITIDNKPVGYDGLKSRIKGKGLATVREIIAQSGGVDRDDIVVLEISSGGAS
jgi:hypothetical protein